MKEYNILTKELFDQGYTKDYYPDYVEMPNGRAELFDIMGGFEYTCSYKKTLVYETPCGLLVPWRKTIGELGYMGMDWKAENQNPVICCPYYDKKCKQKNILLWDMNLNYCDCSITNRSYDYERSIEFVEQKMGELKKERFQQFSKEHDDRICINHMVYDYETNTWKMRYNDVGVKSHFSKTLT